MFACVTSVTCVCSVLFLCEDFEVFKTHALFARAVDSINSAATLYDSYQLEAESASERARHA